MSNLPSFNPTTDEWNDSLKGEFLWSSVNTREAIPDVMTPSTWPLWKIYYVDSNPVKLPKKYPFAGNICGRPYLNMSLVISMYRAVGKDIRNEMHEDIIGSAQVDLEIPIIAFSPLSVIWMVLPGMIKSRRYANRDGHVLGKFISTTPQWCHDTRMQLHNVNENVALLRLWKDAIKPYFIHACNLLRSVTMQYSDPFSKLRMHLTRLVGERDANTLMSNVTANSENLESLMPLVALSRVTRGELSREDYLERYGHRGPHELELSVPGSDENPSLLDIQLADSALSKDNAEERLSRQRAEWKNAWKRFQAKFPREAKEIRERVETVAGAARNREAVRSEVTRITRLIRRFLLQVGKVTELGEDVFYLSLDEIVDVLGDNRAPVANIPVRRAAYEKCSSLPAYPSLIIGPFDPFKWAADPNRRSDYFDARSNGIATTNVIKGFAGAVGCVEGTVRRIDHAEDGYQILAGEILVTVTTNVSWTPLFPRLAAIVTGVGAPHFHAAIVARELGIPAVVGCGIATTVLKTGDRVRVDGGKGIVEIIERIE